jgi:hypothetical protein
LLRETGRHQVSKIKACQCNGFELHPYPTTTIITKDRIYVPVPKELERAFQITVGAKEFYVRFDTIP